MRCVCRSACQYLSAKEAADIDRQLMSDDEHGFTLDQLMELAGLSCAAAVHHCYPPAQHPSVLVCVGPGNNGGDGLVAARHLHHFGYSDIHVLLPREPTKDTYRRLVTQNRRLHATIHTSPPAAMPRLDLIVDAVFGFSFDPTDGIRAPYDAVLQWMAQQQAAGVQLASIDVPSGWHVEDGDVAGTGAAPGLRAEAMLPLSRAMAGSGEWHLLGGRFVPPSVVNKYSLKLPAYSGTEQFAVIKAPQGK